MRNGLISKNFDLKNIIFFLLIPPYTSWKHEKILSLVVFSGCGVEALERNDLTLDRLLG